MDRLPNARVRARSRLPACAAGCLLVLSACGGSTAEPALDRGAAPPPATDASASVSELNQRILAAAPRNPAAADTTPGDGYALGPQDQVALDVFGADRFSGTYRVDPNGMIAIPLLGAVEATGLSPRELEERIEGRLRETYMRDPHVTVHVTEMRSHGVSVMGSVRRPGVYQVTGGRTLLEVLAMAEGVAEGAGSTVYVMRAGTGATADSTELPADLPGDGATSFAEASDVIEVDLGALLDAGDTDQNIVVLPGDIVQVRPAGMIYVVGEVNRPGGFTIPAGRPMTVLQAVAMAQGLGSTAKADQTVIVREHADGSREELPIDLDAVMDGDSSAPLLRTRDVLFVPRNDGKAAALGVVNALVRMVTFRGLFY